MMIFQRNQGISSYVEICDVVIPDNYEERMLTRCSFINILPSEVREIDGNKSLYVKVDGLTPLISRFRRVCPGKEDIKKLMDGIHKCIDELREYLLNPSGIIIGMDYIFYSDKSDEYKFIYVPGNTFDFRNQIKNLFEDIMRIFDHKDEAGVKYLYDTYSQFLRDNFTIDLFIRISNNRYLLEKKDDENEKENDISINPQFGVSEDYYKEVAAPEVVKEEFSINKKPYITAYTVLAAAAVILMIIFGPNSLKLSTVGFLAVSIYTVADINRKKNEVELENTFKGMEKIELTDTKPKKEEECYASKYKYPDEGTTVLKQNNMKGVSRLIPIEKSGDGYHDQILLIEGLTRIGRLDYQCDVVLDNTSVSRIHAEFERHGENVTIKDLGSTNGTYVNESRLNVGESVMLNPGDKIGIADVLFECA